MVGGVVLAAPPALDERGLGARVDRQRRVVDPLLHELLPLLLHLVAGHLIAGHHGQPGGQDGAQQQPLPQTLVLLVLQVENFRSDFVFVFRTSVT